MWRGLAWEALDIPLGLAISVAVTVLVGLSIGFAITFVFAIPLVWVTFLMAAQLGRVERSRAAALLDVNLASPHAPFAQGNLWSQLRQLVTTASRWREIAYLSLALPVLGTLSILVLVLWAASFMLVSLPAYVMTHLPGRSADVGLFRIHAGAGTVAALIVGFVGVAVLAPRATMALAAIDRQVVSPSGRTAVRWC